MKTYNMEIQQFIDDDEEYVKWLKANPTGFVVNSERVPKSNYLVLHRTTCGFINSKERSNWTTTGYIKTCCQRAEPLQQWAQQQVNGSLQPCGSCKPDLPSHDEDIVPSSSVVPQEHRSEQQHVPLESKSASTRREIPTAISTGSPELDLVWERYALDILSQPHVMIPDTEHDLNWHAFLGHSLDMQGFRAAEFAGIDPLSKTAPEFVPLQRRGIGIPELSELWEVPSLEQHLLKKDRGPLSTTLDLLKADGGHVGRSLAEAFETFPYRKGHWTVRALLQNSHALKDFGYSFRNWLMAACRQLGENDFPPPDFTRTDPKGVSLEMALRKRLEQTFFQVGPALAAYMLCDWQLWLWKEGRTGVFATFKLDSFHEQFVNKYGKGIIPIDELGFTNWWFSHYPELPARIANECIWLGMEHGIV